MQRQKTLEFWVGIFVILGFAALLFMALQSANLGSFSFGHKTYAVTAEFDNIGGLNPRAAVKSAGVVVPDQATFVGMGHLGRPTTLLSLFGLLITTVFMILNVRGASSRPSSWKI